MQHLLLFLKIKRRVSLWFLCPVYDTQISYKVWQRKDKKSHDDKTETYKLESFPLKRNFIPCIIFSVLLFSRVQIDFTGLGTSQRIISCLSTISKSPKRSNVNIYLRNRFLLLLKIFYPFITNVFLDYVMKMEKKFIWIDNSFEHSVGSRRTHLRIHLQNSSWKN